MTNNCKHDFGMGIASVDFSEHPVFGLSPIHRTTMICRKCFENKHLKTIDIRTGNEVPHDTPDFPDVSPEEMQRVNDEIYKQRRS
jgi:hypothetical protein